MKYFVSILMITLFANFAQAQNQTYDDLWKKVEKLEDDGLPKSALDIVKQIAAQAKKDNNAPQQIKSLLFQSKYAQTLDEDAQLKIMADFKAHIQSSEAPTKNILENMLATMYWQYFEENRWQFYDRTNTASKVDETDFQTWDLQTLFDEIQLHYQNSLQNEALLQTTRLEGYGAILMEQDGSKLFRPTLYDLLAHNALNFYQTDENSITQPAYKFEIDTPDYLKEAKQFSSITITSKDSSSLQLQALKLYQKLIAFHQKDADLNALVTVDIERLLYVNANSIVSDHDAQLLETLKASSVENQSSEVSALYNFEIATLLFQQGSQYDTKTNIDNRWKTKEALEICDKMIAKYPKSSGAQKCAALKETILQPTMDLMAEAMLPIQQEGLLLVTYKNLTALDFKIYSLSESDAKRLRELYRNDEQWAFIKKLKLNTSFQSTLTNESDYQIHTTEVVLPKLNNGNYLIVGSKPEDASKFYAFATVQITNIGLVTINGQQQQRFQIIDRTNGSPLDNAKVKLTYKKNYNGSTVSEIKNTDGNGEFIINKDTNRLIDLSIEVTSQNDTAVFNNEYVNPYYDYNSNQQKQTFNSFLFTDRSIYRPGQIVYFKGITMTTTDGKSEVRPNLDVKAVLYNVNRELIKELPLKTNAFGSVAGEFVLPSDGLTGQFSIELLAGVSAATYFSVEEYKRPKFETKFPPITETFKVNDSITVKGTALAYAGSNITDAKVVYRISRQVNYPYWYYWYRPWFNSEPQEITHGESTTNSKGEFEITFKAIPDSSVDQKSLPVFEYEITADVTDLNGETRSATTIINVGYHALLATISVPGQLDKTKKDQKLTIDTKNLNGEFVPATGTVKIYKLKAPDRVLRPRPWTAPDYKMLTEAEFKQRFPHVAYADESNAQTWEKGDMVFESQFDTSKSKEIILNNLKKWQSGQYIAILESKDKFGQLVKDEARTTLYDDGDKTLADNQLFSISTDKTDYKIGENVLVTVGSSAEKMTVTLEVEKDQKVVKTYIISLSNNKKTISIPVNKEDLGGFAVSYSYAVFNSFQSGTEAIVVPYPKTDLEIETTTFRDKLKPGTDETWSFKIKGPQGDKVSAELLASMYDMSLDQFQPHAWSFSPLNQPIYRVTTYRRGSSFGTSNFTVYNNLDRSVSYPYQGYDELNWYGFYFGNAYEYRRQYLRKLNLNKPSSYKSTNKSSVENGTIEGLVMDENGLPLPGATINLNGTAISASTDFDGKFSIEAIEGNTLHISYVGYSTIKIKIGDFNFINVTLTPDGSLEEVIVSAFGIVREEKSLGYSTETITADEIASAPTLSLRGYNNINDSNKALIVIDGIISSSDAMAKLDVKDIISSEILKGASATSLYGSDAENGVIIIITKRGQNALTKIKARKNLQETAFFFPQLQTDAEGNVSFSFTTPEALTKWKLQLLAHTKNLESAISTLETVTQKELMVIPNAPRFLRQGDQITISTKIANLTENQLSGNARLELTDAFTGTVIDEKLNNANATQAFSVDAKGNTQVSWSLNIPDDVQAVKYKVVASSGDFSDGEQNALPVLTNRMLVTETLPMWVRSNETRTFTLDKLKNNTSTTLKNHKLTLEITSNPAWYAVQALPYLMEYPYECNEQTFSRYYANALASHIANSNPRIQEVFNQWKNTDALMSNLEKNEELKNILIQETPWLRDAQSETEQKKRIALLFDMNKMNNELNSAKRKLENNQMDNGAWPWFEGGRPNRYITQHIITGFGHLKQLNVVSTPLNNHDDMIQNAMTYLDAEFVQEYKDLKKYDKKVDLSKDHLSYTQLHYLYMRSFFPEIETSKEVKTITAYYQTQIQKYWLSRSLYAKGLMALVSERTDDSKTAAKILKSLKETSISNDELGMYWKDNTASWFWYQAPIETQALMIEVFSEIDKDVTTIDNLKIWLLKNKQTNSWSTTKSTSDAVYALLLQGSDWISVTDAVEVLVGGQKIEPSKLENVKVEAGTGYYKTSWNGDTIKPEMATVSLTKKGDGIAWGAMYWQYFEDLDKITTAETPLSLKKKLFLKTNTDKGEQISEITSKTDLKVGDLVRVRIELRSDRDMEFIHMKDMRAAGFEPVNVLSQYKYQDGLGYYESTKDAATNFFFDYLPKGVYVFEYDLRVNNAGDMSNGITTVQSMYAPEFSSHSEGVRVKVN